MYGVSARFIHCCGWSQDVLDIESLISLVLDFQNGNVLLLT
jgi:hypothetical protein